MGELPPFPAVPPAISCVRLCFTLCIPPLLAVVAGGGSALVRRYHFYGNGALALTFIWATVLGVLIVYAGMMFFNGLIGVRDEGR